MLKSPQCFTDRATASHTYTLLTLEEEKYFPNMSSDVDRMDIRHNWDMLMPRELSPLSTLRYFANCATVGSGSVAIPDYEQYPMLGKPITNDPIRTGPLFEASWTHALHCVGFSILFETFRTNNLIAILLGRHLPSASGQQQVRVRWREKRLPCRTLL